MLHAWKPPMFVRRCRLTRQADFLNCIAHAFLITMSLLAMLVLSHRCHTVSVVLIFVCQQHSHTFDSS